MPLLGAIVRCHCSVLWFGGRVTTNFGGVDVVPLLGAIITCYGWRGGDGNGQFWGSGCGAIGGAIKACYDWVPAWWPALGEWIFHCRVPMHSNGIQKKHPEKLPWASYKAYTVFRRKVDWWSTKKSPQKGVTLMSGISPLAAWLRWLGSRYWRWWNIWIRCVFVARGICAKCWVSRWKCRPPLFPGPWESYMRWCVLNGEAEGQVQVLLIFGGFAFVRQNLPKLWSFHARALMSFVAWKQLCGWDIHLEETKIDIILEALFFSIKGEEEVDYMYNNFCRFGRFRKVTDLSQSHGSSMAVHVWFC